MAVEYSLPMRMQRPFVKRGRALKILDQVAHGRALSGASRKDPEG